MTIDANELEFKETFKQKTQKICTVHEGPEVKNASVLMGQCVR